MNSKRRAELQRKLSMGAVPRPPRGLAERIKAEIPKHLEAHPAPLRFAWGTTMRVAATLITLITTAVLTMELIDQKKAPVQTTARRENVTPAVLRFPSQQTAAESATAPRAETEVSLDTYQETPLVRPAEVAAAAPTARREARREAEESGGAAAEPHVMQIADATVEPAPPPPAPPPPAPSMPAAPPVAAAAAPTAASMPAPATERAMQADAAERLSVTALAPRATIGGTAGAPAVAQDDVFGISIDPAAFPAVRNAIEAGTRPAPSTVDVEALVNYFAGAQSARRDVALEVEASPAPIEVEGDVAILRFTVDTAKLELPSGSSTPAIARDAHLHIDIDPRAVKSFRRIGDSGAEESEEALLYNTSVTGLYELRLNPNLRSTQRVATVRLQYKSVHNGRPRSLSRVIYGHNLGRTWERASRRHRLATLGAIWSETLRGSEAGVEIAKRAEELAIQNPRDPRARELAAAATLSTGGGL